MTVLRSTRRLMSGWEGVRMASKKGISGRQKVQLTYFKAFLMKKHVSNFVRPLSLYSFCIWVKGSWASRSASSLTHVLAISV